MGKIFFASDFHLGTPDTKTSHDRERRILRWMDSIQHEADALYLVGDIFDFWFEYKTVVPKGFLRFLGKVSQWREAGIPIYFFSGNHDIWMFDYFEKELGIPVYHQPIQIKLGDKHFFIGHGDGLGPGDHGYKRLKKVFRSRLCQWLFRWLHPDIGTSLGNYFSRKSRASQKEEQLINKEEEWLYQYANRKLDSMNIDYFIFGHRHLALDFTLKNGTSRYVNLGDWIQFNTYAVFDGNDLKLLTYE